MLQFSVGKMRCEGTVFQLNAEKLTLVPNRLARTVGFAACQLTPYRGGGASCNFNVSDHGEHHPLRQVGRLPAQREAVSNNQCPYRVSQSSQRKCEFTTLRQVPPSFCREVLERSAFLRLHPAVHVSQKKSV